VCIQSECAGSRARFDRETTCVLEGVFRISTAVFPPFVRAEVRFDTGAICGHIARAFVTNNTGTAGDIGDVRSDPQALHRVRCKCYWRVCIFLPSAEKSFLQT
jgi:hypothetical protein